MSTSETCSRIIGLKIKRGKGERVSIYLMRLYETISNLFVLFYSVLELKQFSYPVIKAFLQYLYTDELVIASECALGIQI